MSPRSRSGHRFAQRTRTGRLGTVRVRMTIVAMGLVAVTLAAGAAVLIVVLRHALVDDLTTAAQLRANDVAGLVTSGQTPSSLRLDSTDSSIVQVVGSNGHVLAAGHDIADAPAIVRQPLEEPITKFVPAIDDDHPFRVVTKSATGPSGTVLVVAAQSLEPVDDSVMQVKRILTDGLPAIVLAVGVIAWIVTARALRPVESIRRQAETISQTDLDKRMPVPAGQDEIARLAETLNDMLNRLQSGRDAQRQFLEDASHELRSPLATIIHRLDLARTHRDAVSIDELVEELGPEADRMRTLVQNLLDLARADAANPMAGTAVLDPVDIDELVLGEAKRLRANGRVDIDTTGVSAGRAIGDPAALARVVRNLADNAERHAASKVRFVVRESNGQIELDVSDDGPGIDPADRDRIFDRFVRLDSARARNTGGAGLGLSIVASVISAHYGTIAVSASEAGGARFSVRLPAWTA